MSMLKMSNAFIRTLREDPADAEVDSHKLLVRAGYIRRVSPGIYTWLPLGLKVLRKVEAIVRAEMDRAGAQEVLLPALLPREPYEVTNRWEEYGANLFRLQDRRDNDYLLAPTHEEMFTLAVKDMYSSYRDLPTTLYQIQTKYRDEARPRAGLIRTREFLMKDAYSFDIDDAGLNKSYETMRLAYQNIFSRLGLPYAICAATSGAMGGSRSEEFLFPCDIGEDTFVSSPGGYTANTEAVTTPTPEPQDFTQVSAPQVYATPEATTIDALIAVTNEVLPRADRAWEAKDTLKNVVLALMQPDGKREVIVVGIPGDREIDLKRLEANLAPAEVEMATAEDLQKYPRLIPGYIGPDILGVNADPDCECECKKQDTIRYYVDAHIAVGSSWISGANEYEKHVANLVYGRDFKADGVLEAVQVRAGDPAPDGSGELTLERGIEIGHIFQLGRKYAQALDLKVLDQNGKSVVVTMGSYGIGVSRILAALAELNHDEKGLLWTPELAPAQVYVIAAGKGEEIAEKATEISTELDALGVEVILDERPKVSVGVKFADYELLGIPYAIVVGRGLKDGLVEIRNRASGEVTEVPVADVVSTLHQLLA